MSINKFYGQFSSKDVRYITFRKQWLGSKGSLLPAVEDRDTRLILQPGEVKKATDMFNRKVLFVGTPYGIIAFYETFVYNNARKQVLSYVTTEALAARLTEHCGMLVDQAGYDTGLFESFLTGELEEQMIDMVCEDNINGVKVGDGMPVFARKYPVPKFNRQKAKTEASAVVAEEIVGVAPTPKKKKHKKKRPLEVLLPEGSLPEELKSDDNAAPAIDQSVVPETADSSVAPNTEVREEEKEAATPEVATETSEAAQQ